MKIIDLKGWFGLKKDFQDILDDADQELTINIYEDDFDTAENIQKFFNDWKPHKYHAKLKYLKFKFAGDGHGKVLGRFGLPRNHSSPGYASEALEYGKIEFEGFVFSSPVLNGADYTNCVFEQGAQIAYKKDGQFFKNCIFKFPVSFPVIPGKTEFVFEECIFENSLSSLSSDMAGPAIKIIGCEINGNLEIKADSVEVTNCKIKGSVDIESFSAIFSGISDLIKNKVCIVARMNLVVNRSSFSEKVIFKGNQVRITDCIFNDAEYDPSSDIPAGKLHGTPVERCVWISIQGGANFSNSVITLRTFRGIVIQQDSKNDVKFSNVLLDTKNCHRFFQNYSDYHGFDLSSVKFIGQPILEGYFKIAFTDCRYSEEGRWHQIQDYVGQSKDWPGIVPGAHTAPLTSTTQNSVKGDTSVDETDLVESQSPLPNNLSQTLTEAIAELDALVGLSPVKEQVRKLIQLMDAHKRRSASGGEQSLSTLNFVFSGNPGTGKTTVARIIGKILAASGILPKGHLVETDRGRLVGQHIGATAKNVKDAVAEAMGGVLFIDEAYTLHVENAEKDFGREAIDTLLKDMEDKRGQLCVIVAGYSELMVNFINSNPGLESRFTRRIEFPDYNADELFEVFRRQCVHSRLQLGEGSEARAKEHIGLMVRTRGDNFGNAREMRTYLEKSLERQAERLSKEAEADPHLILPDDLQEPGSRESLKLNDLLAELDSMIGLSEVKKEIRKMVSLVQAQERRRLQGIEVKSPVSLHLVFSGNPGTGKTTVARMVGKIYAALGLLSKGHVIEVARADLVAGYQGQSAEKASKRVEEAYGGVLFIDEAYTLCQGDNDSFGSEVIDTILKEMEDNRSRLAVIVAGYTQPILDFIDSNPGLQSRFTRYINFQDYSDDDSVEIFNKLCSSNHFEADPLCALTLKREIEQLKKLRGDKYGNAREVRTVFEKAVEQQALRLSEDSTASVTLIIPEDLDLAFIELLEKN